jgi:hypothetical protein
MIKKFEEFVNEGLLDIFKGDGCKNLETVCSAFAKRLSSIAPISYKRKLSDGKIVELKLDYSKELKLQYISADDDLVIDYRGKRTIKEEAKRMAEHFKDADYMSEHWGDENYCYKELTKYLYKMSDIADGKVEDISNKTTAIFTFSIPYLEAVKDEKDIYERKMYYYTTSTICKVRGKDDKEIATHLLDTAFYRLYRGLTAPEDKLIEFTDSTDTTFKDIRKLIPSELIDAVKKATKRSDLK